MANFLFFFILIEADSRSRRTVHSAARYTRRCLTHPKCGQPVAVTPSAWGKIFNAIHTYWCGRALSNPTNSTKHPMLIDIFAVLLLSITVLGTQDPTRLNPRDLDLGEHQRNVPSSGGIAARTITNARRLKADSSLGASNRRGDSAASTWCQGHLKLAMGDDENYGFVGKEFNAFGEFTLATHEDDRLLVQLDMSTAMWRPIGIDLVDGPEPSLPFMAGIVGFSSTSQDLTLDSSNYIYLGASGAPTALSNSAQAGITSFSEVTGISESFKTVIFSYDHDGCFDILWVNDDSSEIKAFLGVVDQDGSTMIATGNKEMFEHEFGPTSWVNLSFVSKP